MSYQYLEVEIIGLTQMITINRPEVYGALNKDAKLEIIKAIKEANKSDKIRSLILTSRGKAFSSGQDLNDRTVQGGESAVDLGHTLETEWNPLVNAVRQSPQLVIAAINGVCAGAGLSIALACDLIVAKPEVKFVSGFSQLGLAPDAGSSFTFTRALGYQKTLEFFLWNQPLFSEDLHKAGLINQISEDFLEEAKRMAEKLNQMAPLSLELIKKNLQTALEASFSTSMQRETQTQRFLGSSRDYQEGLKAFFAKRPPQFQGS